MLGRLLLLIASLAILHAAFSTYEHLSHLKALGRPEGALPNDVVLETLVAAVVGIIGASLTAAPLKEITWASEMKKCKIDDMNGRGGFASYVTRGRNLFSERKE
ncbi:hypothetical protein AMATHDRAFT_190701 [Amanita thiersii Skay4041]|uniref:Magnesium transporter n=1 Tax=Amanita thiersii Skay4041 TaxID=703135 RepID=A0A2A9NMM7_9AGAR|nr:hypothetical protein AMATHDRAFT_190701 [Amanita thiersii Skay4041]